MAIRKDRAPKREVTDLLARFATIESYEALGAEEQLAIAGGAWAVVHAGVRRAGMADLLRYLPEIQKAIEEVQPKARAWINGIVDRGDVIIDVDGIRVHQQIAREAKEGAEDWRPPVDLRSVLFVALLRSLWERPFPFARCQECRKVFARFGDTRVKYCSRECAYEHAEDARKHQKAAYMKAYHAGRKAGQKGRVLNLHPKRLITLDDESEPSRKLNVPVSRSSQNSKTVHRGRRGLSPTEKK